jgi:hypothetical protein
MIALLLAFFTGCTTIVRFPPPMEWDTFDTASRNGTDFDPVLIQSASVRCDEALGTWIWDAETDGWTRSVVLDVVDTTTATGWEEQHILDLVDSHPEGRWDKLRLGPLPGGAEELDWLPNINTVFECQSDRSKLTFAMRVWNHRNELNDCIVWGHDAEQLKTRLATDPEVATLGACLIIDL